MATFIFEDESFVGNTALGASVEIPSANSTTTITIGTASSVTFNPFANVVVDDTAGADLIRFRISFNDNIDVAGSGGATMFTVSGGSSATVAMDTGFVFLANGTDADVQAFLRNVFIVANTNTDFAINLRVQREATSSNITRAINYSVAPCYLQGTLIRTPEGDRPVEMLRAGDSVVTLGGDAKVVKWIGHRSYEAEFGASEAFVRPVVFKAGSLGGGLPVRDLKVSPQHGMLVDGAMVPAAALVNGVSIMRDQNPGDVSYFHIELDSHEAVFAEGAASETFVDHDSRAMFDNADEYNMLYGNAATCPVEQPRLEEGSELAAIRRRLAEIAGIAAAPAAAGPVIGKLERIENGVLQGWMVDAAGAEAVEAEVLVDGEVVGRVVANRYRGDLDQAGIAGGRGGFTIALPASAERLEQVSVRRIVDGQVLAAPMMAAAQA